MDRNESRISEITNKIVDEIEDTFEEYAKSGKRHSTRGVMQKILDKYKSEIISDTDKDYVNKELKYRYFLYTNKQPKDFVFESRTFTPESRLLRKVEKILDGDNIKKQVTKALEEEKWIVQALDFDNDEVIFQHLFDNEHDAYIDFCKEFKKSSNDYIEVVRPDEVVAYSTDELIDLL